MNICPNCGSEMVPGLMSAGWCKAECDLPKVASAANERSGVSGKTIFWVAPDWVTYSGVILRYEAEGLVPVVSLNDYQPDLWAAVLTSQLRCVYYMEPGAINLNPMKEWYVSPKPTSESSVAVYFHETPHKVTYMPGLKYLLFDKPVKPIAI